MPITRGFDAAFFDARYTPFTMQAADNPSIYAELSENKDGNDREMFPDPLTIRTHNYFGMGPFEEAYEGETFGFDQPQKGHVKTTTYKKFGKGFEMTEEFMDDSLIPAGDAWASDLGNKSTLTKDLEMAKIMDNVGNTTYYTTPDGLALASRSHTLIKGGVSLYNTPANSSSCSLTGWQDMLMLMYRQTDERGYSKPAIRRGDAVTVLTQPEDTFVVDKFIGNGADYLPDSVNTATINPVKNRHRYNPIENPFQVGIGASPSLNRIWAMLVGDQKDIWHVVKKPLTTSTYTVDGTKSVVFDARERYAWHINGFTGSYFNGI
jgi:hypothetical protein